MFNLEKMKQCMESCENHKPRHGVSTLPCKDMCKNHDIITPCENKCMQVQPFFADEKTRQNCQKHCTHLK